MATTARHEAPDRNLALELVRVTEAAAMAAGRWVGRGDKNGADGAAVNAMRQLIHTVSMNGVVVIGEGEKDEAPMLFNGEQVGDGKGPECDVAVDPIDGTRLTALGMGNAISVMAVAERGAMFDPSAVFYMEKLATGADAADVVDITAAGRREHPPGGEGEARVAVATSRSSSSTAPATSRWCDEVRATGARIKFITDGDVAGAIMAAREGTGVDLLLGIGGTPEGIIAACALKMPGRRDPGPAVAEGRRRAAEGDRRRPRPRPGAGHRRPGARRRRLLRRHRHHRRRAAARRPLPRRRRAHPLAGDALTQRHDPHHRERAQARQAAGLRLDRLRERQLGALVAGLLMQVVLVLRVAAVHRVLERFRVLVEVSSVRGDRMRPSLSDGRRPSLVMSARYARAAATGRVIAATAVVARDLGWRV